MGETSHYASHIWQLFDIRTLLFAGALIAGTFASVMYGFMRTRKTYPGYGCWAWAELAFAALLLLQAMRGDIVAEVLTVALGNVAACCAMILLAQGMRQFCGERGCALWIWLGSAAYLCAIAGFYFVRPDLRVRSLLAGSYLAAMAIYAAWPILRRTARGQQFGYVFTASVLLFGALVGIFRVLAVARMASMTTLFSPTPIHTAFFVTDLMFIVGITFSFFLLTNERSVAELCASNSSLAEEVEKRHTAERALHSEILEREALVDNLPDVIWSSAVDGQTTYVSSNIEKIFGYTAEEICARGEELWFGRIHATDAARVLLAFQQLFSHNRPFDVEYQVQCRNGNWIWVHDRAYRTRKKDGVMYADGIFSDITARKQAEAALERSERRYRQLFERNLAGSFRLAADGRMLEANAAILRMFGYDSLEEMQRVPAGDFYYDPVTGRAGYERLLREKVLSNFEFQLKRKDGTALWVLENICVVEDEAGGGVWLEGTCVDITEQKKTEQQLRESEIRFRELVETTSDWIWQVNVQGKYTYSSPKIKEQLGYDAEELLGRYSLEFVDESDYAAIRDFLRSLASQPRHFSYAGTCLAKDGSKVVLEMAGIPLFDEHGQFRGYRGIGRDVTERVRNDRSLKLFRMLLDESNDHVEIIDPETLRYLDINEKACNDLGYTREEILALKVPDIASMAADPVQRKVVTEQLQESGMALVQDLHRRKDGTTFPVETVLRRVVLDGRAYVLGIARDISRRKEAEESLRRTNEKLSGALQQLQDRAQEAARLTELVDLLQSCESSEEAYKVTESVLQTLFSHCSGALCITNPSRNIVEAVAQWGGGVGTAKVFHPHDCWALRRGKAHCVPDSSPLLRCPHVVCPHGHVCVPLVAQGETLGLLYAQYAAAPASAGEEVPLDAIEVLERQATLVSERIALALANLKLREVLRGQSIRDPLTNLFNRRYMEESLERELRRAATGNGQLAVLMLDIDHFKRFNDTFGHAGGDLLLRELGSLLTSRARGQDIVCRYGGEEFVCVFSDITTEAACKRGEQLREAVKQLSVQQHGQVMGGITVSIGVAEFPDNGDSVQALLKAADDALYIAKGSGRDQVIVAPPLAAIANVATPA